MSKWKNCGVCGAVLLLLMVVAFHRESLYAVNVSGINPPHIDFNLEDDQRTESVFEEIDYMPPKKGDSWRPNGGIAYYSEELKKRMANLLRQKVYARHPDLVQLVRDLLDPPSRGEMLKLAHLPKQTPQSEEIQIVLNNRSKGFFIECGALDGERSSNTLYLEKHLGWTGILVEMDPHFYTQLLGKARKSWSLNACISPYEYATKMTFKGSPGGRGQVQKDKISDPSIPSVPCFPLETILLALNHTHVDYFSLDVEGAELDILKTIPYDRLTIDTFSVEYRHGKTNAKKLILDYMQSKDYRMHKDIAFDDAKNTLFVKDYIFVRNSIN